PWTRTEKTFRREDFALLVESSREPATPPPARAGNLERTIAKNAAAFVPDSATLEFGLGVLPDLVCSELAARKHLTVHSGTIGDGVVDLMQAGAVTRTVSAQLIGTRKLFDFAHDNPALTLRSTEYTHGPHVLGAIERF